MNEIVLLIGSFVISVLLFVFPVLTTCSFILDLDAEAKFFLTTVSIGELIMLTIAIRNSIDS